MFYIVPICLYMWDSLVGNPLQPRVFGRYGRSLVGHVYSRIYIYTPYCNVVYVFGVECWMWDIAKGKQHISNIILSSLVEGSSD